MIFPSYIFILVFLPAVLLVWFSVRNLSARLLFLTLASYVFYGWWDYRFVLLMLASTALDYVCGQKIYASDDPKTRKRWLLLSVAGNLASLGFFKYYNFFVDSLSSLLGLFGIESPMPVLQVVLPIGISFYTFQSMSYTIDIYRRDCKPTASLLTFTAYVSMFPQLVAGPIVRYSAIEQQLASMPNRKRSWDQVADGAWLFMIGLVKKVWIADLFAPMADLTFDGSSSPQLLMAWAGALSYTFQLYFDFSAYSDMARGLGFMLGFDFPINFRSPYKSKSISEFWNRWHITLSNWLRDYLFIPLGGSREGTAKTMRNLAIVMFLGGLWHGAAWTFVVWGIFHGCLLMLHALWKTTGHKLPKMPALLLTFVSVVFGWVLFRATSLGAAFDIMAGMIGLHGVEDAFHRGLALGFNIPNARSMTEQYWALAFFFAASALAFFGINTEQLKRPKSAWLGIPLALVLLYTMTTFMEEAPFLYFQF